MQQATLRLHKPDGTSFDTPIEKDYYRAGGILPYVLAQILGRGAEAFLFRHSEA
jgi:aconitate hydratase